MEILISYICLDDVRHAIATMYVVCRRYMYHSSYYMCVLIYTVNCIQILRSVKSVAASVAAGRCMVIQHLR